MQACAARASGLKRKRAGRALAYFFGPVAGLAGLAAGFFGSFAIVELLSK